MKTYTQTFSSVTLNINKGVNYHVGKDKTEIQFLFQENKVTCDLENYEY